MEPIENSILAHKFIKLKHNRPKYKIFLDTNYIGVLFIPRLNKSFSTSK